MVLGDTESKSVCSFWKGVEPHAEQFGSEALWRMFCAHPQTKTYFTKFDIAKGSSDLNMHGKRVMDALTLAMGHLDDICHALEKQSFRHANVLMVEPTNFTLLIDCMHAVFGLHFGQKYTPYLHAVVDKFLCECASALMCHYR
ncbi:hemoglobin subunit alpha-1-like [Rhinatrema bivittatum]|uniref:hemoglobin subunit alpha-1-like n=1 Tax=Rhinatrema bivittatum TaxID=194408 RepID=UPI00112D0DE7|nr:hemoglobin subunit alpha-1-like [Rhinatrema bivittatum]